MVEKKAFSDRKIGTVKWYRSDKKFGFIIDENEEESFDVFFHISEFKLDVIPQSGQVVEYLLVDSKRGYKAIDCVFIRNCDLSIMLNESALIDEDE